MGRRARRERDALEMIEFARRALRAAARHAGDGDEFELAEFASVCEEAEELKRTVIARQRSYGRSWAYIGGALGITRQSAQERYGEKAAS